MAANFEIERAQRLDHNMRHAKTPSVLFVCTANICRSPMASALLTRIVSDQFGEATWRVESAGTWARGGEPATEEVRQLMKKLGVDLSRHRSRIVDAQMLQSANLVLTMEGGQKEILQIEFPKYSDRIYMLSEMIGQQFDIDDPFGGTWAEYERTAHQLEEILTQGLPTIKRIASQ